METLEEEQCVILICIIIIMSALHLSQQRRGRPWVRQWIGRRDNLGAYHALIAELRNEDPSSLKNFLRMDFATFNELLQCVSPLIQRRDTLMRDAISPAERLALTLRFLATGDSYRSLEYLYRIPVSTASTIIPETCIAIYNALKENYLKIPQTQQEWMAIANSFDEQWDFPNCIGAIDGKHVLIKCPTGSGSTYFNYKNQFSIILLALVDADYKFLYVDVGTNGRANDSGILARSALIEMIESGNMNLPPPRPLPERHLEVPFVIVGDDAFPLKPYLMKPFPKRQLDLEKRVFNYRLSRARRIVENAFGILSSRFGIFQKPLSFDPDKVKIFVLASCVLHNYLRSKDSARQIYTPEDMLEESDKRCSTEMVGSCLRGITQQGGNRCNSDARSVRDEYCDYFNTNGSVEWQWDLS
ncbi:uncharacterized protein LOC134269020 [Saccostrea cucullata]|uniref:uncharacterized protein LOC134269020 n=1 Tax=Saccostrea cuccullata TaxID=36930 RepID=UPI002ED57DA5